MQEKTFNSSFGLQLPVEQVIQTIVSYINENNLYKYKVIIGTDSERHSDGNADFVTAIVVQRVGKGGRYFWRRHEVQKVATLRNRMYQEALMSLEIGKEVLTLLKKIGATNYDFEIHVDVGENGATKVMLQELVGMVRANNFEVRTKPDSYAASKVADRHV
ncbi:MAG: ribonuclease H-like YkuK family protein [bacterium]|nr:ribonuclease H-like YkuK family protein [bacterium]